MPADQDAVFIGSEADLYFERNRHAYETFDPDSDLPSKLISLYRLVPASVAEVGAANGIRVASIARSSGATAVAIEPSGAAIADGRRRFPEVEFVQARAASIPLERTFDLVIVNGVFCWIDRKHLLASVAQIDRLVADGGFLLIGDFWPTTRQRVPYHHLPGQDVYTYKQDYTAVFLASGLYHSLGLISSEYSGKVISATAPEVDRVSVVLLWKLTADQYPTVTRAS